MTLRDQTSDRNKESSLARAERGLWNGGHLLGYDLPADGKKGTLIPNEHEAAIVNFAFESYLKTGSILKTAQAMNEQGFRTKEYDSRRGKFHPARKFTWTGTMWLLTNWAYIGKKEVNKKKKGVSLARTSPSQEYRLVDATWPGIVPPARFHAVQKLLQANSNTSTNQLRQTDHCYVLNHGLLTCGKYGGPMEGTCGTSHGRKKHYYYACKNKECRLRIPADDIEHLVLERVKELAISPAILPRLVAETNERLQNELPDLTEKKLALDRELQNVRSEADGLLTKWLQTPEADSFVKDRLGDLTKRRQALETSIAEIEKSIATIERDRVDEAVVRNALATFAEVFNDLPPYQKKEMIRLVLHGAKATDTEMQLAFHGAPPDLAAQKESPGSDVSIPGDSGVWLLR